MLSKTNNLSEQIKNRPESSIRAVIFDLGMVLVDFRYVGYMEDIGFDAEMIDFFKKNIVLSPLWCQMDRGDFFMPEAADILCGRYPERSEAIRTFFANIGGIVREYPDSRGLVETLKQNGISVYILSNYPEDLFELHAPGWTFLPLADGAVISAKVKLSKPEPAIYRLLLSKYQLKAEECVFVDDRPDNIEAANSLGIRTVLADHREEAFRTLFEELGIPRE